MEKQTFFKDKLPEEIIGIGNIVVELLQESKFFKIEENS
jgi:hypothetical protein